MGMNAEILGLGRFDPVLVPHLMHPPERYAHVRSGALLLEKVVPATPGSSTAWGVAAAVGVSPWDFDTHALDVTRIDWDALRRAIAAYTVDSDVDPIIARFQALAAAGFRFWFRPNG
jgi:hypothetical protein